MLSMSKEGSLNMEEEVWSMFSVCVLGWMNFELEYFCYLQLLLKFKKFFDNIHKYIKKKIKN